MSDLKEETHNIFNILKTAVGDVENVLDKFCNGFIVDKLGKWEDGTCRCGKHFY